MDLSKTEPLPDLPRRLRETLVFVASYFRTYQRYPTQNEIARGIGLSKKTSSAAGYIEPLVRKGYLSKSRSGGRRNIRLTALADAVLSETDFVVVRQNQAGENR
jgi:hypothetical protein